MISSIKIFALANGFSGLTFCARCSGSNHGIHDAGNTTAVTAGSSSRAAAFFHFLLHILGSHQALCTSYTDEELLQRVLDLEAIRDLMNRRFYYIANEKRREEINEMWVTEPELRATASFGKNWGYYVGMRDITEYYVVKHYNERKAQLDGISQVDPSVENIPENMYIGCSSLHSITTPRLMLAYDGKTAQGLWHSVGLESYIKEDGTPDPHWITERIGADFIKEKNG